MDDWHIQPLDKSHDRGEFCCGNSELDEFLRTLACQYERRRLGRTYVAVRPDSKRVYGFYTLASSSISFQRFPSQISKKLPKHPVPTVLLGRLAVDQAAHGRRLGELLLTEALKKCVELADRLGVFAVEVKAIDEPAQNFYRKYGFTALEDDPLYLIVPMKTIAGGLL